MSVCGPYYSGMPSSADICRPLPAYLWPQIFESATEQSNSLNNLLFRLWPAEAAMLLGVSVLVQIKAV